ncbi:hypothetical protein CCP3SC1AL1_60015 [Gammaproteobacteria bacterium]
MRFFVIRKKFDNVFEVIHNEPPPRSGSSSVGRAQPCQGWGREFESRLPLQVFCFSICSFIHAAGW